MYIAKYIGSYSTCHKKLYDIRGLSASEIRSFPRHRRGYPRNRVRVSAESIKGVRGIVQGCPRNREWVSAES